MIGRSATAQLAAVAVLAVLVQVRAAEPPPGEVPYRELCADCHGASGHGDGTDAGLLAVPAPDLRAVVRRSSDDDLVRAVREGRPIALDATAIAARARDTEAVITHLERLPGIDWRRVERGEQLWVERCEVCHGRFGQPGPVLPPGVRTPRDLSDPTFQKAIGDDELASVVRHGRQGMPAIPAIRSDDDAHALVAWVRLLSPGLRIYTRLCASCHGDDGRADDVVDPGVAPRVVFDRAYFARQDPEHLRVAVWHMLAERRPAMPHFRTRLTEKQVRDIVSYLRTLQ